VNNYTNERKKPFCYYTYTVLLFSVFDLFNASTIHSITENVYKKMKERNGSSIFILYTV